MLAFGINSGAYVAKSLDQVLCQFDKGQFEAGRSIGFNHFQTMIFIIMPQAFKNVLPALANEFVVLLKRKITQVGLYSRFNKRWRYY